MTNTLEKGTKKRVRVCNHACPWDDCPKKENKYTTNGKSASHAWTCKGGPKDQTERLEKMKAHFAVFMHTVELGLCKVDGCDFSHVDNYKLTRHTRGHYPKEDNLTCQHCGEGISPWADNLKRHEEFSCPKRPLLVELGLAELDLDANEDESNWQSDSEPAKEPNKKRHCGDKSDVEDTE